MRIGIKETRRYIARWQGRTEEEIKRKAQLEKEKRLRNPKFIYENLIEFDRRLNYLERKFEQQSENNPKYICTICETGFTRATSGRRHNAKHARIIRFIENLF
jgi:hypothetical protein